MALNHSALKRPSKSQIDDLAKKLEDSNKTQNTSSRDERFWHPEVDSAGNGGAVIRFLPSKTDDGYPFVKVYDHGFQNNGQWYIEACPTTKGSGNPCPVCEDNSKLWNSGIESDKDTVRQRKRRLRYISNVLVVKDPAHPENEGQVKLFRYGIKIFEKIQECFNADSDIGEEPFNPFGFFDGANFAIKIVTVGGFINYDKSKFIKAPDLYDGDEEKLMEVLDKMSDLQEFVAEDKFKSYDDLAKRFNSVVYGVRAEPSIKVEDDDDVPFEQSAPKEHAKAETPKAEKQEAKKSDDDDDLAFFQNLLQK